MANVNNYDAEWEEQASAPSTPGTGNQKLYPKSDGWYWLEDDGTEHGPLADENISKLSAATELTISAGSITITQSHHTVDTQSDASSDELETINGGVDGERLWIRPDNDARSVVLKHGTGNIYTPDDSDVTLTDTTYYALLIYDSAVGGWILLNHGAGGGGGYPYNVVTVDAADADADYSDLASAIAATSADDVIMVGPGSYTADEITVTGNRTIIGVATNPHNGTGVTQITNSLQTSTCMFVPSAELTLANLYLSMDANNAGDTVSLADYSNSSRLTLINCYAYIDNSQASGVGNVYVRDRQGYLDIYGGYTRLVSAQGTATKLTPSSSFIGLYNLPVMDVDDLSGESNATGLWYDEGSAVYRSGDNDIIKMPDGIQLAASGASVTTILDEDDMASNSATALATQQSIKEYIGSQVQGTKTLAPADFTIASSGTVPVERTWNDIPVWEFADTFSSMSASFEALQSGTNVACEIWWVDPGGSVTGSFALEAGIDTFAEGGSATVSLTTGDSSETPAAVDTIYKTTINLSHTVSAGDWTVFRFARDTTFGTDTATGVLYILGVRLTIS